MAEKQVVKNIQARDIEMLHTLYKYRALSTQQMMRHFSMSSHYANKKMHIMRNSEWIRSYPILSDKHRKIGAYHSLAEGGLSLLRSFGYEINRKADELRVSRRYLPFLLTANDLYIELAPLGWTMRDSREIKAAYGLNRGNNIHGSLEGPALSEHGLYIFMSRSSLKHMMKVIREIKESPLHNFVVFTKGQESFASFIEHATVSGRELIAGGAIKVIPFGFGKVYLPFISSPEGMDKLLDRHGIQLLKKQIQGTLFEQIVRHEAQDKYFVNLLDTDLMKVYTLKRYHKDRFEREGKRVVVLTHMRSMHEKMLGTVEHIDYVDIHPQELAPMISTPTEEGTH